MNNYLHINIPFFWGFLDTAFLRDEEPSVRNERQLREMHIHDIYAMAPSAGRLAKREIDRWSANHLMKIANAPRERCAVAHTLDGVVGSSEVTK